MEYSRRRASALAISAVAVLAAGCSTTPESISGTGGGGSERRPGDGASGIGSSPNDAAADGARLRAELEGIGDRVFFDVDRSDLNPVSRRLVERWAQWLQQNPRLAVTIEGHCDERGTREYNMALGERRAAAAQIYLVSLGIDAKRVSTLSYGKERPAVVGSYEQAWSQNRRAVLVVD